MTSTGPTAPGSSLSSVPLKRLGPVRENASFYSAKGTEIASNLYSYLKQYAPKGVQPQLAQLEDTVSSYSYPAIAKIQDRSDSILKSLDGQVDYVAKQAGGYYGSASSSVNNIHSEHVQRFHKAKANYSGKLSEQSQYIDQHGIVGFIRSLADSVYGQASIIRKNAEKDAGAVEGKVKDAFFNFQELPLVQKFSSDISYLTSVAWSKYLGVHDAVLGTPAYHNIYNGGVETVGSIQSTGLYQRAKTQLYPTVAPYADPALDNITSNSYYKAAVDHVKPVQANGKL